MLSDPKIFVSQHLSHNFNGNTIEKRYNSGKSVPGQMDNQILFDATEVSDFLKIGIGLLVAQNR